MKRLLILSLILLISSPAFANEWKTYAFQGKNGVYVIHLAPGANLETELEKIGYAGVKTFPTDSLPSKKDIKYWKIDGDKVVTDEVAKQADIDAVETARVNKDTAEQAVLDKLKITKDELDVIREKDDSSVTVERADVAQP